MRRNLFARSGNNSFLFVNFTDTLDNRIEIFTFYIKNITAFIKRFMKSCDNFLLGTFPNIACEEY